MGPIEALDRANITALLVSGLTAVEVARLTGFSLPFVRRVARSLKRTA